MVWSIVRFHTSLSFQFTRILRFKLFSLAYFVRLKSLSTGLRFKLFHASSEPRLAHSSSTNLNPSKSSLIPLNLNIT